MKTNIQVGQTRKAIKGVWIGAMMLGIMAVFFAGCGEEAETKPLASPTQPTPVPTGVTAMAGVGQIALSWNPVDGATSYNIYWSTSPHVSKSSGTIITSAFSPYTHTGLTNGTTYYYMVTAFDALTESTPSAEVSASPTAGNGMPDLVVSALEVLSYSATTITYLYTITNIGDEPALLDGPTDMEYDNVSVQAFVSADEVFANAGDIPAGGTILGLSPLGWLNPGEFFAGQFSSNTTINLATHPYLTLKVDWGGSVTESNENNNTLAAFIETQPSPFQPPGNVTAVAGDSKVTISWNPVDGATSYNIYWSTSPHVSKSSGTIITSAFSPYTHTGLTNGTTYYYVVTAINAEGESGESAEVAATPYASPPPRSFDEMGDWENIDPYTRGITRVNLRYTIADSVTTYYTHVYGSCSPTDCNWGEVTAERLDTGELYAVYNFGWSIRYFWMSLTDDGSGLLHVILFTDFSDADGRTDYWLEGWFRLASAP